MSTERPDGTFQGTIIVWIPHVRGMHVAPVCGEEGVCLFIYFMVFMKCVVHLKPEYLLFLNRVFISIFVLVLSFFIDDL